MWKGKQCITPSSNAHSGDVYSPRRYSLHEYIVRESRHKDRAIRVLYEKRRLAEHKLLRPVAGRGGGAAAVFSWKYARPSKSREPGQWRWKEFKSGEEAPCPQESAPLNAANLFCVQTANRWSKITEIGKSHDDAEKNGVSLWLNYSIVVVVGSIVDSLRLLSPVHRASDELQVKLHSGEIFGKHSWPVKIVSRGVSRNLRGGSLPFSSSFLSSSFPLSLHSPPLRSRAP